MGHRFGKSLQAKINNEVKEIFDYDLDLYGVIINSTETTDNNIILVYRPKFQWFNVPTNLIIPLVTNHLKIGEILMQQKS
jgi:hypothetical protein